MVLEELRQYSTLTLGELPSDTLSEQTTNLQQRYKDVNDNVVIVNMLSSLKRGCYGELFRSTRKASLVDDDRR